MKLVALLCLLLTTMVEVSIQQCAPEEINTFVYNRIRGQVNTEGNNVTFSITTMKQNCLSTSQIIGQYTSASVSVWYITSENAVSGTRFNLVCNNDRRWDLYHQSRPPYDSSETAYNCYDCTNQTYQDHCLR